MLVVEIRDAADDRLQVRLQFQIIEDQQDLRGRRDGGEAVPERLPVGDRSGPEHQPARLQGHKADLDAGPRLAGAAMAGDHDPVAPPLVELCQQGRLVLDRAAARRFLLPVLGQAVIGKLLAVQVVAERAAARGQVDRIQAGDAFGREPAEPKMRIPFEGLLEAAGVDDADLDVLQPGESRVRLADRREVGLDLGRQFAGLGGTLDARREHVGGDSALVPHRVLRLAFRRLRAGEVSLQLVADLSPALTCGLEILVLDVLGLDDHPIPRPERRQVIDGAVLAAGAVGLQPVLVAKRLPDESLEGAGNVPVLPQQPRVDAVFVEPERQDRAPLRQHSRTPARAKRVFSPHAFPTFRENRAAPAVFLPTGGDP